jgi:hypothetical protein
MDYLIKSNFLCNGVQGVQGQFLTDEQLEGVGAQLQELIHSGCIISIDASHEGEKEEPSDLVESDGPSEEAPPVAEKKSRKKKK